MTFAEGSRQVLGYGSLLFGAWGLIHPESLTRLMGDDPAIGRWLGVRDALVGAALLRFNSPAPFVARVVSDVSDAVRLQETSPGVAFGALGFAAWAAAAALATARRDAQHS